MRPRKTLHRKVLRCVVPLAVAAALAVPLAGPAAAVTSGHPKAPVQWTFERDRVGELPTGCTTPAGTTPFAVTDERAYRSRKSLELNDSSASSLPMIGCAEPAQQGAALSFRANPAGAANGFVVDLTGSTAIGSGVVFELQFRADGSVGWTDGSRWLPVAPAGTMPQQTWSTVAVGTTGDQDMAYVWINGRAVGSAGPWGVNPVTSVTGFQLAGFGTPGSGDRVFFDDVSYGSALRSRPAAVKRQYQIGDPTTIVASTTTTTQMPNTAARVPLGHGRERILASYPAHTDVGDTAGNQFVYSDDGGKTWTDYQTHNPLPDAPSFYLTRLHDGSLYAINYHGYANGNSRQSVIESAVSTDNGASWTNREGLLTAPADLAPYDCERPSGCTAFVQVHNVIEDPDGTLYQSAYGKYDGDTKYRQLMLISHDGGLDWSVRATVAFDPTLSSDPAYAGPCEGVFVRTGPHSFLAVMRTGSYQPMYSVRSDDDGRTWTTPQKMKTVTGQPVSSVFPSLERLGDGSLLLMVGRPGLSLLRSFDNGETWSDPTWVDYTNSANGYLLAMGGTSVMVFGDRGAAGELGGAPWQSPVEFGVWNRTVTAIGGPRRPGR
ncbi:sialidase family protein [Nakamurella lactea]|uniref:sialidase family protein n=1 Tax=Nakamurella lactea TaxID=459515 RepID=UPI000400C6C8|nr:sialidase family protein [Nakamurella lactea]